MSGGRPLAVDVIVRADAVTTGGGDMVQVAEYERHLDPARFDLRIVPFHPAMRLRDEAIVHVVNIDRPHDFLGAVRAAAGHRVIASPIHHDAQRVLAMRRADRGRGMTSLLTRVLPDPVREGLGTMRRAVRGARGRRALVLAAAMSVRSAIEVPSVWRRVGAALNRCDAVALLAEGEGRALMRLSGWRGTNAVLVPNGLPEQAAGTASPWTDRAAGSVLVVGRIEPRKRQLEVARAADRLGVTIDFVGPHTAADTAYSRRFGELAAGSASVRYLGALPRDEVLVRMGRTRVLLNASWVEVQSLVDLEAAEAGCAVVTSGSGHSREWLGAAVEDVPGGVDELVLAASARAAAGSSPPPASTYTATWADAAERLAALYERRG